MTSPHDAAGCELVACDRCDSYGDGYSAGKAAAHFELRVWDVGAHSEDCGCAVCGTARVLIRKVVLASAEPDPFEAGQVGGVGAPLGRGATPPGES